MKQEETSVKVLFRFFSNVLDEETVETMWVTTIDKEEGLYKIDNIPFYAPISSEDIIFAEYDENEKMLTYRETVEYSGNSTIQVVIMNESFDINKIRDIFKELGCPSERLNHRYFSMEIPASINYITIKDKLDELFNNEILDYAEACLSDGHKYE
jgi:hypothetical protein